MHGRFVGRITATSGLPAGHYVGYGLTLLVACQEARWSGNPDQLALGDEVPLYILALSVKPAGTDPGPNGRDVVEAGRVNAPNLNDVIADRGYSTKTETFVRPLHAIEVNITMDFKVAVRRKARTITVGATTRTRTAVHIHCGTILPHWINRYWEKPPARETGGLRPPGFAAPGHSTECLHDPVDTQSDGKLARPGPRMPPPTALRTIVGTRSPN